MPLDPSIILSGKPVEPPPNPLDQYGRVLALKNALTQNQSGQLQLQQQQQDMADQQKMRQAYMESGGDLETLQQKAMQMGVGPNTLMKLKDSLLKQRETLANIDDKELTVKKAHTEAIGAAAQSLLQLPPEQRPQAYGPVVQALAQQGRIKPGEVPAQYPGDEQIQGFANSARTAQQLIDSVMKEREVKAQEETAASRQTQAQTAAATAAAKLPGEQAQSAQQARANLAAKLGAATSQAEYQQILGSAPFEVARDFDGKTPEQARRLGMTAEQQTQADQQATNQKNEQAARQITERIAQGHLNIAQADLELKKQQFGFDTNGGVSPTAQMAAEGKIDPQTLRAILRRNPGVLGQIKNIDPNFDEAQIDNRYNTLKEFTNTSTGKAGGQALALNTLIHHADLYLQTAEALKNGSFRPGNQVYNAVAQAFGSAPPTNAALVAHFFAGETGKVATGGVPAEGEINGVLKNLSTSAGPDQIEGAAKTLLQIAAGRATPLMERVNQANLGNVVKVLGPDAQQILQRNGFDPQTMKPIAPAGNKPATVTTKAEYEKLPSGSVYIDSADGKQYRKK